MRKSRPGLTILAKMTKAAVTLIVSKRKTKRLKKINYRRNVESLSNLPGMIRFGNDNLIIVVRLIMRFHRFHPSLAARPQDHAVKKKTFIPEPLSRPLS
jgi:hypothetical protein